MILSPKKNDWPEMLLCPRESVQVQNPGGGGGENERKHSLGHTYLKQSPLRINRDGKVHFENRVQKLKNRNVEYSSSGFSLTGGGGGD